LSTRAKASKMMVVRCTSRLAKGERRREGGEVVLGAGQDALAGLARIVGDE
jgi:hypothetical protein